jgi:hypothetical protein
MDELLLKWGDKSGDGDLRDEMLADREATKVDELQEWDSDEDMEDVEVRQQGLTRNQRIVYLFLLTSYHFPH